MHRLLPLLAALALAASAAAAETPEALVEEKARDAFGAELPEGAWFRVTVQDPKPGDAVMISSFWIDRASGQFLANLVLPDGGLRRIGGLAVPVLTVPVPARRMMPDEIVAAADLTAIDLPLARIGTFAVTDPAALIGQQVRRVLAQGRPVMVQSVMQPLVIDRGDKVSIRYDDGLLSLAAPGRALDDAHRGQDVRVVNLVSNTTLVGTASGEGIVEVRR